jgi:ribonucleoside-diphosphate reductase alpha chain
MEEQSTNIWWLNEESEQMLNRGYLLKGETVEGAIDRITTAAAKRLYKPELQPAFKEMITKGWISFFFTGLGQYGNPERASYLLF